MDDKERFLQDIQFRLVDLPEDIRKQVYNVIMTESHKYNITKDSRDIVPYNETSNQKMLQYFLISKKVEGRSDKSLQYYAIALKDVFQTINKPIKDISTMDLRVYIANKQMQNKWNSTTCDNVRRVLGSFYRWANGEEILQKNPVLRIDSMKKERTIKRYLSFAEMEKLRVNVTDKRDVALIEFFYSTACRVSEVARLNISDVNFQTNSMIVYGKGSKERYVYLTERAALRLKIYLDSRKDDNPALFVAKKSPHSRLEKNSIEKIFRDIGKEVGIDRLHPHKFRRTAATHALQKGMSLNEIQRMLGHANANTTQIYAITDDENVMMKHRKVLG